MTDDADAGAARSFVEEAEAALRFLRDDHGFEAPVVEDVPFAVWVTFTGQTAAVKAAFDTRDRLVEIFLVKLVDGELPPYDETEATHYIDTVSLAALARGDEPSPHAYRLQSLTRDELSRVLRWHADVVREFGDILGGDFGRFEEAIAARRAHISRLEDDLRREQERERPGGLRGLFRRG
jgi:hypothetical protein